MAVRGNTPVPVEQFGGLRLDLDPTEVGWGQAIDLKNVDFDRQQRVRSRWGTEVFTAAVAAEPYRQFVSYSSSTLVASGLNLTAALNSSGAITASTAVGTFTGAALIGTPAQGELYTAYGSLGLRVYNGTAFATPTATVNGVAGQAMPQASYLGVTPWDNRLVCGACTSTGGPAGIASSLSHLHFSEPGDPQTFNPAGAQNHLIMTPGDGEAILAIVNWREYMFVFKSTKFFVFYGTSTDRTGKPIFNYRTVRAGVGPSEINRVVAAVDGVYFSATGYGIYRTTGGEPELVSQHISPVFQQGALATSFFTGPTDIYTGMQMSAFGRRVFCTITDGRVFAYDTDTRAWTYWDVPTMGTYHMVEHKFFSEPPRLYFGMATANHVARFSTGATDNGAAIATLYRSGFHAPGGPGSESTVRETLLEGSGTVGLAWSRDYGAVGSSTSVTMSTPPAQGRKLHAKAVCGGNLSYQLAVTGTAGWQVNRLVPRLRETRGAGQMTAAT